MKKISVTANAEKDKVVRVYWDSEWQEYQVHLYVKGELIVDATYFTDDKQDALATAAQMVK